MKMNFYLLYGLDKDYINKRINKIISKLSIDINDIVKYNLVDTDISKIIEEASMNSMFSSNKLIIVNFNLKDDVNTDILEKYFKNYNPSSYIIFYTLIDKMDTRKKIYKLFLKYGKVEEINNNQDNVFKYVKESINNNSYNISYGDISYFISKVGTNISNIDNELEKLYLYKLDDKNITREDIDSIVISTMDDEIFAITNAVVNNDVKRSIFLYNEFMNKNYEPTQIIGLLANQFHFLYQVKYLYNQSKTQDEISKTIEAHPYRVKLAIANLYNYTESDLLHYLDKLAILDQKIKSGQINKNTGLELFLINKDI